MDLSQFDQGQPANSAADADLSGMTRAQAQEYVQSYVSSLKKLQKQLREAEEQLQLWQKRARLAYDRSDRELARVALEKWEAAKAEVQRLRNEEQGLARTVDLLKQNYQKLKRAPELSVDANALNEQLEQVVGSSESRRTERELKNIDLDSELENLKRKMNQEDT
ncbi:MAG: PspA/IM30 family protein [Spirochaetales bacterium]